MQPQSHAITLPDDARKLVGLMLVDVCVRTFFVELVFLGTWKITVRINKRFKFAFNNNDVLSFDPTLETQEPFGRRSEFIYLRGRRCQRVVLNSEKFEVDFAGESNLWVEFENGDFEPLELVGMSGLSSDKLEFYYVF